MKKQLNKLNNWFNNLPTVKWWKSLPNVVQDCDIQPRKEVKWVAVSYSKEVRYQEIEANDFQEKIAKKVFPDTFAAKSFARVGSESQPMTRDDAENFGKTNFSKFYLRSV